MNLETLSYLNAFQTIGKKFWSAPLPRLEQKKLTKLIYFCCMMLKKIDITMLQSWIFPDCAKSSTPNLMWPWEKPFLFVDGAFQLFLENIRSSFIPKFVKHHYHRNKIKAKWSPYRQKVPLCNSKTVTRVSFFLLLPLRILSVLASKKISPQMFLKMEKQGKSNLSKFLMLMAWKLYPFTKNTKWKQR